VSAAADWQPSARIGTLRRRAAVLRQVRAFFDQRGVLEVETPALATATVTDPALHSLAVALGAGRCGYLQTSPEFFMKRLLAAGSGPIWQLARAFRGEECGRWHGWEFSMLEWYRPGFDHHRLLAEVVELITLVLGPRRLRVRRYAALFAPFGIDPHRDAPEPIAARLRALGLDVPGGLDRDGLLDLLLSHRIAPTLGRDGCIDAVHAFPVSQAALARITPAADGEPPSAARFEVHVEGVELANGYHELTDAAEQARRFETDQARRHAAGLPGVAADQRLLAALAAGLPDCAGVALGFDRLLTLGLGLGAIAEVQAFAAERA
jgi:elongation factor P--(R)-beta-lysine ligase